MDTLDTSHLEPIDDGLVMEPLDTWKKSSLGLFLPEGESQNVAKARVIAVGPGRACEKTEFNNGHVPVQCRVGDVVLVGQEALTSLMVKGKHYLFTRENMVMTIIERAPKAKPAKKRVAA